MVLRAEERGASIEARIAILYTIIEATYSCLIDPEPVEHAAQFEMTALIDKETGEVVLAQRHRGRRGGSGWVCVTCAAPTA